MKVVGDDGEKMLLLYFDYQPVEKGRAKLPLSRKHREIRLGRSLALPEIEFFNGLLVPDQIQQILSITALLHRFC